MQKPTDTVHFWLNIDWLPQCSVLAYFIHSSVAARTVCFLLCMSSLIMFPRKLTFCKINA